MSDREPSQEPYDNTPSPQEPQRRPEKPANSNAIWYLAVAGLVVLACMVWMGSRSRGTELTLGEFEAGLEPKGEEPARFTAENVHNLKISPKQITFRNQPLKKVALPGDGEKTEAEATPDADKDEEGQKESEAKTVEVKTWRIPVFNMGDVKENELTTKLTAKGVDWGYADSPSEWYSFAYLMFIPLMMIIFFVFVFRRIGGAGSAMSFGRSRGRMYAQEDIGITFNDVAGIDEAVEELREVVEFLRTPAKYQALGGRIPRGVLLVGPPGTGKTLLAKAVAGEAGVPFFGLSGSDFVEMYVGVGAARVRDMFQQAGAKSPAIIFIDELDALGKTRGSGMPGGHDEREQTLNALLVEMDGFSSDQSVIVMGATNRPETLDPALLRPGRFDRNVVVDRPDIQGREQILKVHATKIKMDDSVEIGRVARMTPGFVGADLANLVNEAALLAARADKKRVTMIEFEEGIERVVAGLEKQTRIIHEEERLRVSYHECGHALVACSLPHTDPVHKVSIIPRGMGLGYTLHFPADERQISTKIELFNRICCLLGGIAAEEVVFDDSSTGGQNDLQRATSIARRMVTEFGMSPKLGRMFYSETSRSAYLGGQSGPGEVMHSEQTIRDIDLEAKKLLDAALETALDIMTTRRAALDALAQDLLICETMDSDKLKQILDEYKTSPQLSPGTRTKRTEVLEGPSENAGSKENTDRTGTSE